MRNYSLSIYRISINKRLNKDEKMYLSDYDNGKDLLAQVKEMLDIWKFENIKEDSPTIAKDEDEKKISRILQNADGSFELHSLGRCISGIIESGEFGTEENIINSNTGELKYRKRAEDAQMIPFFFLFNIPEHSYYGYLIIERIRNVGIYSILTKAIQKHIERKIHANLVLKIEPFMIQEVFNRNLSVISEAKKVILKRVYSQKLNLSQIAENLVEGDDVQTDVVYRAPRNRFLQVKQWIDKLNASRNKKGGYTFQNIEYADVAFELKIGGKVKTVSIAKINGLGTNLEITDNVELGANGYPTYNSLKTEAQRLLSFIRDEDKK